MKAVCMTLPPSRPTHHLLACLALILSRSTRIDAFCHGGFRGEWHGLGSVPPVVTVRSLAEAAAASSSALAAKKKSSGGGGFGSPKKENDFGAGKEESSPSIAPFVGSDVIHVADETFNDARDDMEEFFASHEEWKPLFRDLMTSNAGASIGVDESPLADSFFEAAEDEGDNVTGDMESIWDMDAIEGRRPWARLPSKPTDTADLEHVGNFLDEWQKSLIAIPVNEVFREDGNDLAFVEEGRRTIAVSRFHVLADCDGDGASTSKSSPSLFATCWSELAHLASQNEPDTGSLVILPGYQHLEENGEGLEEVRTIVLKRIARPLQWLGRHRDVEITAMERGNLLAIRLLYKLSDIPDLASRSQGGDD